MTFDEYKRRLAALEARRNLAGEAMARIRGDERGPMGLTPDHIKARPDWQAARRDYQCAFDAMRKLNAGNAKRFRREIQAAIDSHRQECLNARKPADR